MIDPARFRDDFERRYRSEPSIFSAPGRVNLIGEHTDYNEGFVMPFAIDRQTLVGVSPRTDHILNVYTLTLDKTVKVHLHSMSDRRHEDWSVYVTGMIEVLEREGIAIGGADMLIDSDIPFGAGLSSSAALEVAVGCALFCLGGRSADLDCVAFAGHKVEHDFIGVRSGIMDQFASAFSSEENALLIDCRSFMRQNVPLELGHAIFVVCDTKVKHSLASSAYNQRRSECEEGVELLSEKLPGITALRDVGLDDFHRFEARLPDVIRRRCRHVIAENERTLKANDALHMRDLRETGRLMNLSHKSLRDDYEVSCPELDLLQSTAVDISGVYGSRMTGGGFGGCTITLLKASAFDEFESRVTANYRKVFNQDPSVFPVTPSGGAREITFS